MKKIIAILLLICLLASFLVGCCETNEEHNLSRFKVVDRTSVDNYRGTILVDTKTNVMYLRLTGQGVCGITVLVDADGKPLLWEG